MRFFYFSLVVDVVGWQSAAGLHREEENWLTSTVFHS